MPRPDDSNDYFAIHRRAKEAELRDLGSKRDRLATIFAEDWRPLVEHMERVGRRHLPPGTRLTTNLKVDDKLSVQMRFHLEKCEPVFVGDARSDLWRHVSEITFYNFKARDFKEPGWLGRVFRRSASPDTRLRGCSMNKDAPLDSAVLNAADMFAAKQLVENWLATYIAFDFDDARLHPVLESGITVTRKGAYDGPGNTP